MCCRDEKNYREIAEYLVSHQAELIGYARKLTCDSEWDKSYDLYQETAYRALSHAHSYKDEGTLGAWIHKIMHNISVNDRCAYDNRIKRIDITDLQILSVAASPDVIYEAIEVKQIIGRLKRESERRLITMWLQGYSYDEIAQKLNMKLGTVKSGIYRLKSRIRFLME